MALTISGVIFVLTPYITADRQGFGVEVYIEGHYDTGQWGIAQLYLEGEDVKPILPYEPGESVTLTYEPCQAEGDTLHCITAIERVEGAARYHVPRR